MRIISHCKTIRQIFIYAEGYPLVSNHALYKFATAHDKSVTLLRPTYSRGRLCRAAFHAAPIRHSTVTDLARFLGLSTSVPRATAV
jgi:hypothetical protein